MTGTKAPTSPALLSFDVFGTLISVREGSYAAFEAILKEAGGAGVDVRAFWEHWEERNIAHYRGPYKRYRDICAQSLAETFEHYALHGDPRLIERYFDAFPGFQLYPDVERTLDALAPGHRLAIVSNIDDDLLALTPLKRSFDLFCTAERARGYKPDGSLFRYLLDEAKSRFGITLGSILHSGQSQHTDMVGAKPLGIRVAWINRRSVPLHSSVPRPDHVFPDVASLLRLLASAEVAR